MTFPNLENLNIALSINISIDTSESANESHVLLRLKHVKKNKKTHFELNDQTIKIWDLPYTTNYGDLKANIEL